MPAVIGDPTAPVLQKGQTNAFLDAAEIPIPQVVSPKQVTLRDRLTIATLLPFTSAAEIPLSLLAYLCDQLNKEIEKGDTYALMETLTYEVFALYWFANFGAVMLLGDFANVGEVQEMDHKGTDWSKICLGSFNIKPNYPGRSSHICNGMFLVTDAARNKGVGRLMGECYLEWAPQLGYTYSVFNLMYETNVAMCRIWDALGFKRIGKVPGAGNLKSHPGQLVDAIIYGRDLNPEGEDFVSEERFDKIRFYLKHQKYPVGADRAEKSRLRSAATHYKLVGGENGDREKLMLKDKEVVSDPQQQYDIARSVHYQQHGGINKTTATIALRYHWVRIKETVSMIIKSCPECKETAKPPPGPEKDAPIPRREKSSSSKEKGLEMETPSTSNTDLNSTLNAPLIDTDNVFMTDNQGMDDHAPFDNKPLFDAAATQLMQSTMASIESMDAFNNIPIDTDMIDDMQQLPHQFSPHDAGPDFTQHNNQDFAQHNSSQEFVQHDSNQSFTQHDASASVGGPYNNVPNIHNTHVIDPAAFAHVNLSQHDLSTHDLTTPHHHHHHHHHLHHDNTDFTNGQVLTSADLGQSSLDLVDTEAYEASQLHHDLLQAAAFMNPEPSSQGNSRDEKSYGEGT